MNDSLSILLATTILGMGGLGLYMFKSSIDEKNEHALEEDYDEEGLFGSKFWGDKKEKDDESESDDSDDSDKSSEDDGSDNSSDSDESEEEIKIKRGKSPKKVAVTKTKKNRKY
jgi:hypothetical protein